MNNLLYYANTEGGRYLLSKLGQRPEKEIVDIGKDFFIEHLEGNIFRSTFFSRKPIYDLFAPIITQVNIARDYKPYDRYEAFLNYAKLQTNSKFPQIYLAQVTFNPDANPETSSVDGAVGRENVNETFSTIRGGNGTDSQDSAVSGSSGVQRTGGIVSTGTTNQFYGLDRAVFVFYTASLPENAVINSAILSLYGNGKNGGLGTPDLDMVSGNGIASTTSLTASDFQAIKNNTTVFDSITYGGFSTSAYNDFNLDSNGIANISLTAASKFCARLSWDTDNSFGGSWSASTNTRFQANYADDGVNIPKLVVSYILPGGAISFGANF